MLQSSEDCENKHRENTLDNTQIGVGSAAVNSEDLSQLLKPVLGWP